MSAPSWSRGDARGQPHHALADEALETDEPPRACG
jgi:hypothetical protein